MRAAAALLLTALALAGCDTGDEPERRVTQDARRVGETVQRLERALAGRDFRAVCTRLFTRGLVERMGGSRRCAVALRRSSRGLRRPRIRVETISLQGSSARVRVVTTAAGQAPARDVLVLRRERGAYRVNGLSGTR